MKNKKRILFALLICCCIQVIAGCAETSENKDSEEKLSVDVTHEIDMSESVEEPSIKDSFEEAAMKERVDTSSTENETLPDDAKKGLYDRSFLVEEDGIFTYGLSDADLITRYDDLYTDAYTLVDTTVMMICDGGDKFVFWLGPDGDIYKMGSSGAAYSGASRLHYDSSKTVYNGRNHFCDKGMIEDEYFGYLYDPVHINGSTNGITTASQVSESQISAEEMNILTDEWRSRYANIQWLKFSDYMEKYPQKFE